MSCSCPSQILFGGQAQRAPPNDQDYPNFQKKKSFLTLAHLPCEKLDTSSISHGFDDDPTCLCLPPPLAASRSETASKPISIYDCCCNCQRCSQAGSNRTPPKHHHDIESCIRRSFLLKKTMFERTNEWRMIF